MSDPTLNKRKDSIENLLKEISKDTEVDAIIVFGYSIKKGTNCAIGKSDNFLKQIPDFCDWYVLLETVQKELFKLRLEAEKQEALAKFADIVRKNNSLNDEQAEDTLKIN